MATYKVPHWSSYIGSAGNNVYIPVASTYAPTGETVEANAQIRYSFDGTISNMFSRTRVANTTGDTTFTLRINGVATAMTWTVPQNATGEHGYTGSVSFASGDLLSLLVTTTTGSISELVGVGFLIESDDGETRQVISAYDNNGAGFSTSPRYIRPAGELLNNLTSDAVAQNLIHNASTLEAMSVYVEANARTSSGTISSRINGANGGLSISIPASTTGRFNSTGTADSLAVDDFLNASWAAGGTGTTTINSLTFTILSTNKREVTLMHGNNISRGNQTTDQFAMQGNRMSTSPTELAYITSLRSGGVLSRFSVYASASTATQNLLFQSRVNQADANMTLTMSTAGWYTDTTNSDTIDDNDLIGFRYRRAGAGTGTTTLRATSVLFTLDEIVSGVKIISSGWWGI